MTSKINDFTAREAELKKFLLDDRYPAIVLITTYSMLSGRRRTFRKGQEAESLFQSTNQRILQKVRERHLGLFIADEVQTLVSKEHQKALQNFSFHCKIGLTATPYREDEKIGNLFFMIGPKLYEENWLDMINNGYLANPLCVEIRCKMSEKFLRVHQNPTQSQALKSLLEIANPQKFLVLSWLVAYHEKRKDKIIIFCDRVDIIENFSERLRRPMISGKVESFEREYIFDGFRKNKFNTIFVSRVGDSGINLPSANVGI